MSITAYISELLEENEYVIIPGFGAFFSSYQPAKLKENNMVIHPPSRLISFNSELRMDDGILLNYIIHRMKISSHQAHQLLEQYIDDIVYRLHSGESVDLQHIGIVIKSGNNILFEAEMKDGYISEAFGLSPVEVRISESGKEDIVSDKIAEPIIKKKKNRWMSWLILLPAIALFSLTLTLLLTKEKIPKPESKPDTQNKSIVLPVTKNKVVNDAVQTKPENPGTTAEDIISGQLEEGLYYLIGGSFRSEKNADEYLKKMTDKGYHPVFLGKVGNFYLVALDSFKTTGEATEATNRLYAKDPGTGVWIYHPE